MRRLTFLTRTTTAALALFASTASPPALAQQASSTLDMRPPFAATVVADLKEP